MIFKLTSKHALGTSIVKTHKGVSEIIVTLILLSVTVIGAVLVFTAFQGTGISEQMGNVSGVTTSQTTPSIKIVGHDTRDGPSLVNITDLDNTDDDQLTGGEFIVLHIRNSGSEQFLVDRLDINDVRHVLSNTNPGTAIDSNPPSKGTFKVIEEGNATIKDNAIVFPSSEVRLVVGLSDDFTSDPIRLNQHLRVVIYPATGTEVFKIIEVGSLG